MNKQEILEKARLLYCRGARINSLMGCNNYTCGSSTDYQVAWNDQKTEICGWGVTLYCVHKDRYKRGQWAEIIFNPLGYTLDFLTNKTYDYELY